jgi:uncharacterized coiled-coil protein SlyX
MTYIKILQKQINELNDRIRMNQGDVSQLQKQLDKLKLAEFEEDMREESNQQLLKG